MDKVIKMNETNELSKIEDSVNAIASLYAPYVEEAKKIVYKHIEWFKLDDNNIGILNSFYKEDSNRLERRINGGRKLIPDQELSLLDFNLESYIISSYERDRFRTTKGIKVS